MSKTMLSRLEKAIKQKGNLKILYDKKNDSLYGEMGEKGYENYTAAYSLEKLILGLLSLLDYENTHLKGGKND